MPASFITTGMPKVLIGGGLMKKVLVGFRRRMLITTALATSCAILALPGATVATAQRVINIDTSTLTPYVVVSKGVDQPAAGDNQAGAAGGSSDGLTVTQAATAEMRAAGIAASFASIGGTGGNAGTPTSSSDSLPGGAGGSASDVAYTIAPPDGTGVATIIGLDAASTGLVLQTVGGNGGKGSDTSNTGTGGAAGLAGQAGNVTLNILQNPALPSAYTEVTAGTRAIDLLSQGGAGGAGGYSHDLIETVNGVAGAGGSNGGTVTANLGVNLAFNSGDGVRAISQGGAGGTGGDGTTDIGKGKGGSGGVGGNGGAVTVNEVQGSIAAIGNSGTTSVTILDQNGDPQVVQLANTAAAIFAGSRGGIGGAGGSGDGAVGQGGSGGAAGNGRDVAVNISTPGIYQPTGYGAFAQNGAILTKGDFTVGVLATSIGGAGGDTVDVGGGFSKKGGNGGVGGNGGSVSIDLGLSGVIGNPQPTLIQTQGDHSDALVAMSVGGGGGYGANVSGGGFIFSLQTGGSGAEGGQGGQSFINNGIWDTQGGTVPAVFSPGYVISTLGDMSFGVFAQSVGGGGGRGGDATGINLGVSGNVIGGSGGTGGDGGTAGITNYGIIQTAGAHSIGVFAQSVGGGGGAGGAAVSTEVGSLVTQGFALGGDGGVGGNGGEVDVANFGQVITGGANAIAVFAQSVGGGGGDGGSSLASTFAINPPDVPSVTLTVAIGGKGKAAGNGGGVSLINTGLLATQGDNAIGVFAQSIGGGGGNGGDATAASQAYNQSQLTVTTAIGGSGGGGGNGGVVTIANSGLIQTLGFGSTAVFAQSVGGGGGNGGSGETNQGAFNGGGSYSGALTVGIGGNGGTGGNGGAVIVTNFINDDTAIDRLPFYSTPLNGVGGILTVGDNSNGVFAQSIGGGGGNGGDAIGKGGNGQLTVSIAVGGNGGIGGEGGAVTVANGQGAIVTIGAGSAGIFAQSVGGGGGNGGSAQTGSGNDPQYTYPEFLADQFATAVGTDPNTSVQKIFDGIWDWKDNVQSAYGDVTRLMDIYKAYQAANPAKGLIAGGGLQVSDLTVDLGGGFAGNGGSAGNGGDVTITSDGAISTAGPGSVGMFGQSVGGGGGSGGAATSATANDQLKVSVVQAALALGGAGGSSGNGGTVLVLATGNASVITRGDLSDGLEAQSIGGGGGTGGFSTTNAGLGATNVSLGGSSGTTGVGGIATVESDAVIVATAGNDAIGLFAQSIGGGGGVASVTGQAYDAVTGLAYSTTQSIVAPIRPLLNDPGNGSYGGLAIVKLGVNSAILTQGINSYGILAQSIGGGGGLFIVDADNQVSSSSTDPTNELYASAGDSPTTNHGGGGAVDVSALGGSFITTSGAGAVGILAQSIGGGGAIVNGVNGIDLDASSTSGLGQAPGDRGSTGDGGNVSVVSGATIVTTGAYAHGIFAEAASGGGGLIGRTDGTGVAFFGSTNERNGGSCGSACGGEVTVALTGGSVTVSGAHAFGIVALSIGNDKGYSTAQVNVQAGASVIAKGDAAGAILLDGQDGGVVNNAGIIDASASAAGVAIAGKTDFFTVNNSGTINGSLNGGGLASSVGAVPGQQAGSVFNNLAGGIFNAGAIVNLGAGGVINNAGQMNVGQSGTIAVTSLTGNFTQTGAGTLVIDADIVSGKADMITVSGTATIGGVVRIQPTTVTNKAFTVLIAAGGVTLSPSLTTTNTTALFSFTPKVSGNTLVVQPSANFTSLAADLGSNQRGVAANLQTLFDSGASMDRGFNALSKIASQPGFAKALDTLSGQAIGTLAAFRFNSSHSFVASMYSGCATFDAAGVATDQASCGWARTAGSKTSQDATSDALGYSATAESFQLGLQRQIATHWFLSGSVAYEMSQFDSDDYSAKITGNSLLAGTYLRYHNGPLTVSVAVDTGYGWYDSKRTISVGNTSDLATASPKVWHAGLHSRIGYELPLGVSAYIRPFVDGHAVYVHSDAYAEAGSSPFNLAVEGEGNVAVAGAAGLEAGGRIKLNDAGAYVRPFASASYEALNGNSWAAMAHFVGQTASQSFRTLTPAPDRLGKFTAGFDIVAARNVDLAFTYAPEIGQGYVSHAGVARLACRF
jgi:hypothetical protein